MYYTCERLECDNSCMSDPDVGCDNHGPSWKGSGIATSRHNTRYKGTVVAPQGLGATIMDNNDEASLGNMNRGEPANSLDDR